MVVKKNTGTVKVRVKNDSGWSDCNTPDFAGDIDAARKWINEHSEDGTYEPIRIYGAVVVKVEMVKKRHLTPEVTDA